MLTGDNERTANAVAAKLGIAEVVADAHRNASSNAFAN